MKHISDVGKRPKRSLVCFVPLSRLLLIALPLALGLLLLFPLRASAHAVLLRSDPAPDTRLRVAPDQVRLWFSEALNPAFSTVAVENANTRQRVDNGDARVPPDDSSELVVTLHPHLPAGIYVVIWRSDSNDDGHIESDSFLFIVTRLDGTLPKLPAPTLPEGHAPGSNGGSGVLTIFSLLMVIVLELGAVFWVGAQYWLALALSAATRANAEEETRALHQQIQDRFERRFALPALLALVLANTGILLEQAVSVTGGPWAVASAPATLGRLITSGPFGIFWLIRELLLVLALRLAAYLLSSSARSSQVRRVLHRVNLGLGFALFATMALSSHAAAVQGSLASVAVIADWVHLLAAAFWIGGMLSMATLYVPLLTRHPPAEQARSLITVLASYTPWAAAGVLLMAVTGPFSATLQVHTWKQMLTTLYGQALTLKILLVGALLLTSAIHVFLLRPRLHRAYRRYTDTMTRFRNNQDAGVQNRQAERRAHLVMVREKRLAQHTRRLLRILSLEPVLGVAVLICVGFMNVFAGTLAPTPVQPQQPEVVRQQPFHATMQTFDHRFTITLEVSPNQLGTNVFTVGIANAHTGKAVTQVAVDVNTEMLDMDMGIGIITLRPDGHGQFSGQGDLVMSGHWQIIVQIRTPDDPSHFHEAYVRLVTP